MRRKYYLDIKLGVSQRPWKEHKEEETIGRMTRERDREEEVKGERKEEGRHRGL